MTSNTVQAAQRLLAEREAVGLKKYGTTVDRTDLQAGDWLQHAIEEASDLLLYLIRLRETMQPAPAAERHIETAPSCDGSQFLAFGRGGYYDSQGSWEKVVRHEDGGLRLQNGLPADEAEYWFPLPKNPCSLSPAPAPEDAERRFGPITSDPADAERNIRAKEDAERAAYLARWEDAPEWAQWLSESAHGVCKWHKRKPELVMGAWTAGEQSMQDAHDLLGSVRCESRPTTEASNGDLA